MLRRHWWIIALLTAIGIVGAAGFVRARPKVYEATTYVLVTPTSNSANAATGRTSGVINLDTEAQLVTSAEVATEAAKLLKVTTPPSVISARVSIDVPPNTTVLAITFDGGTPIAAQSGSHAFATAYLDNRQGSAQASLTSQINALTAKIKQQTSTLTNINNSLAGLQPGSAKYANEQSQRQTLTSQITALTNRLNTLSTTTVAAGEIITDATLPTAPTSPSIPLFLTSGATLGLLLGIAVAVLRQRADKRVRFATDVPRRSGLPLLAQLPARVKPRFDDVFPPYGTGGRTFSRLRNEVLASLHDSEKVIVVTGASRGTASTLVAANLASALARAGSEVVLVGAHLPASMVETAPTTRMLGVAATPGLSDVLAGKVPLETATQRAPRNPWLRVITTGGTASATGFLQSQTLRDILTQLRAQAEYVVIEAPSTANTADAQSLASLADASIVVVELRRTTHLEVLDAADQLRRVSPTVLGSVVLPRLRRQTDEPPTPPPAGRPLPPAAAATGPYVEAQPTTPINMTAGAPRHADTSSSGDDAKRSTGLRRRILANRNDRRIVSARRQSPERANTAAGRDGTVSDETVVFDVPVARIASVDGGRPAAHGGTAPGGGTAVGGAMSNGATPPVASGPAKGVVTPKGAGPTSTAPNGNGSTDNGSTDNGSTDNGSTDNEPTGTGSDGTAHAGNATAGNGSNGTAPNGGGRAGGGPARVTGPGQLGASAARTGGLLGNVSLPDVGLRPATPMNPTSITGPVLSARSIVITKSSSPGDVGVGDDANPATPRASGDTVTERTANPVAGTVNGLGMTTTSQTAPERVAPVSGPTSTGSPWRDGDDRQHAGPGEPRVGFPGPGEPRVGSMEQAPLFKRIDLVFIEDGDGTTR